MIADKVNQAQNVIIAEIKKGGGREGLEKKSSTHRKSRVLLHTTPFY